MLTTCTVTKKSLDGKTFDSSNTKLEEIGGTIAHTLRTDSSDIYTQNVNLIIDIRKVDTMHGKDRIFESRAEQSRAEQSRAEQSSLIAA